MTLLVTDVGKHSCVWPPYASLLGWGEPDCAAPLLSHRGVWMDWGTGNLRHRLALCNCFSFALIVSVTEVLQINACSSLPFAAGSQALAALRILILKNLIEKKRSEGNNAAIALSLSHPGRKGIQNVFLLGLEVCRKGRLSRWLIFFFFLLEHRRPNHDSWAKLCLQSGFSNPREWQMAGHCVTYQILSMEVALLPVQKLHVVPKTTTAWAQLGNWLSGMADSSPGVWGWAVLGSLRCWCRSELLEGLAFRASVF